MSYQDDDREIIDYAEEPLAGTAVRVRGPLPASLESGFVAAIGAAQTFGRFVAEPFPMLLARELGVEILNLGLAGAGPGQFLKRPNVVDVISRSQLAIVQVLSGRSISNSHFENVNAGRVRPWDDPDAEPMHAEAAYRALLETHDEEYIRRIVSESRENYVQAFSELLAAIRVPKILFWFSRRKPDYQEGYDWLPKLFGGFPQLVNAEMIERLKPLADEYVECISGRGLPQPLRSRFTGEPVVLFPSVDPPDANHYYPSPEMHLDAAEALRAPVRTMLKAGSSERATVRSDSRSDSKAAEPRPVFVLGAPRSGTSVLTWCIGQHSNIAALPETLWIAGIGVGGRLAFEQGFSSEHVLHLNLMDVDESRFLSHLGRGVDAFVLEEFEKHVARNGGGGADPDAPRAWRRNRDVRQTRWVDGTPFNSNYALLLQRMFPKARFIHLLRRPDEVVRSLTRFEKLAKVPDPDRALWMWKHYVRVARLAEDGFGSAAVMRVCYEDLIGEPEEQLARISTFLDEEYESAMLLPLTQRINSSFTNEDERDRAPMPEVDGLSEALELYASLRATAGEKRATQGPGALEAEVARQTAASRLW